MPLEQINIGSAINAGDGEAIRNAFAKVNAMLAEIYGFLSPNGFSPDFLAANSLVDGKLATMPANSVKANLTGAPASPANVSLNSLSAALFGTLVGEVKEWAGPLLPANYLWADGAAYSRATRAALLAAITAAGLGDTTNGSATIQNVSVNLVGLGLEGATIEGAGIQVGATISSVTATTIVLSSNANATASGITWRSFPHGNGDGSTTFNVPDRRGRAGFGRDNMGGAAASRVTNAISGVNAARLGASGGDQRMQQHNHGVTDPAHNHPHVGGAGAPGSGTAAAAAQNSAASNIGGISAAVTGISIQNSGAGSSQNMPPASVQNFIVFAGA